MSTARVAVVDSEHELLDVAAPVHAAIARHVRRKLPFLQDRGSLLILLLWLAALAVAAYHRHLGHLINVAVQPYARWLQLGDALSWVLPVLWWGRMAVLASRRIRDISEDAALPSRLLLPRARFRVMLALLYFPLLMLIPVLLGRQIYWYFSSPTAPLAYLPTALGGALEELLGYCAMLIWLALIFAWRSDWIARLLGAMFVLPLLPSLLGLHGELNWSHGLAQQTWELMDNAAFAAITSAVLLALLLFALKRRREFAATLLLWVLAGSFMLAALPTPYPVYEGSWAEVKSAVQSLGLLTVLSPADAMYSPGTKNLSASSYLSLHLPWHMQVPLSSVTVCVLLSIAVNALWLLLVYGLGWLLLLRQQRGSYPLTEEATQPPAELSASG